MTSGIAVLLAVALVLIALALMLWSRAERRAGQASSEQFLDSRFAAAPGGGPSSGKDVMGGMPGTGGKADATKSTTRGIASGSVRSATTAAGRSPGNASSGSAPHREAAPRSVWAERTMRWMDELLSRAGIARRLPFALIFGLPTVLLCLIALSRLGVIGSIVMLVLCLAVTYFILSVMTSRRHQALIRQLPPFLDAIVRLLTIGNSIPSAFQTAIGGTEAPLRECLERVSRMLRSGVDLDRALYQTARVYKLKELELLAAVMRLAVKYGGRADVVLERMSGFMRDLDMAQRELVALTAETRLSAWVLCLLPILIGMFLVVTNPLYFANMWLDDFGRELLYGAGALQVLGCFLLYRLAKL